MKIFLSIKYRPDQRNRQRIESILAALARCCHGATCIVRDIERWGEIKFDAAELMRRTFAKIDASDLVLVDLTEKSVGIGIEAGYALAKQIPIVTIAERGADVSETLQGISRAVFFYDSINDLDDVISQINLKVK
jgi:hypothetical protein